MQGLRFIYSQSGSGFSPAAFSTLGPQGYQGSTGPIGEIGPQGPSVAWNYLGNWTSATSYYAGSLVTYNGSLWYTPQNEFSGYNPGYPGTYWELAAEKGSQGPQGLVGQTGTQGFQGEIGPQGTQGFQGEVGQTGTQGFQGEVGPQGFQGEVGPQGFQGFQGFQGEVGPQGFQGFQGEIGPQGFQGFQGEVGPQGYQGFQGDIGSPGFQGDVGPQGYQGEVGSQGFQGETGPQGDIGLGGPQGEVGKGFYVFATVNSFDELCSTNPTESNLGEFVLILGGELYFYAGSGAGTTGPTGCPTSWEFAGDITDETKLIGSPGPTGSLGPQGFQGFQGSTGPQGYQGPQGTTGQLGSTGPQGFQGTTGQLGSTGPQGFQGTTGQLGSTGPQGFQGFQGTTGQLGSTGPQGFQGPQGTTGQLGSTGPQGSTGSGFTTITNFGTGRILISTGSNSAIAYSNLTYDGNTLYAPTFTGSNIYASTQHLGNSSDSVTLPSYSWLGDTNCGMYHPATDNIGFVTNGSEVMRISQTGNVGIGTNGNTAIAKFQVSNNGTLNQISVDTGSGSQSRRSNISLYSTFYTGASAGSDVLSRRTSDIDSGFNNTTYTAAGDGVWGSEYMAINVGNNGASNDSKALTSEKMRITASGYVGIGTSNPSVILDVSKTGTFGVTAQFFIPSIGVGQYNEIRVGQNTSNYTVLSFQDGGNSYLGSNGTYTIKCDANQLFYILDPTMTDGTLSIVTPSGQVSSSSDMRVKNSIQYIDSTGALDQILLLKPATFKYNFSTNPNSTKIGFIAQDVEQVIPLAIDGKKFEYQFLKDEEGNVLLDENNEPILDLTKPRYRGLDQTAIIATLVNAIKEQNQTISQLQNEISAIKTHLGL